MLMHFIRSLRMHLSSTGRPRVRSAWRSEFGLLLLACGTLLSAATDAAGRTDLSQLAREPRTSERSARVQEMRRQLLEHQRDWLGNVSESPTRSLRDLPAVEGTPAVPLPAPDIRVPLGHVPLGPVGPSSPLQSTPLPPITPSAAGNPGPVPEPGSSLPDAVLPAQIGIPAVVTPATASSVGDARLSDRERTLLREQLRQWPRLQPGLRGNSGAPRVAE